MVDAHFEARLEAHATVVVIVARSVHHVIVHAVARRTGAVQIEAPVQTLGQRAVAADFRPEHRMGVAHHLLENLLRVLEHVKCV